MGDRLKGAAAAVLLCLMAGGNAAAEVVIPTPGGDGWQPLSLPKVERHTAYTVVQDGGKSAVRAESHCSASALTMPVPAVELRRTPRLAWQWKVQRGLDIADEQVKSGDDFAARVYVMFRFDPERASWWERMRHRLGEKLYGADIPGDAINYVWTSRTPAGHRWDNPFTASSKMVSLGSGPLPQWRREEVDVTADYRGLFGTEPPPLLGIAVMSDSDNSCQEAVAYFADFRFRPATQAGE